MELNKYQEMAMETCMPSSANPMYMAFGLMEEVGEMCGKMSKAIRKDVITINHDDIYPVGTSAESTDKYFEFETAMKKEMGDCLWMLAGLCTQMGWTMENVAQLNLAKLAERKKNGTIIGNGDGVTKEERNA